MVLAGGRSFAHQHFSYVARSQYAAQLERWYDAVSRERLLVVESERMFADSSVAAGVLEWLGFSACEEPFPVKNRAPWASKPDDEVIRGLQGHFQPFNQQLFELLGGAVARLTRGSRSTHAAMRRPLEVARSWQARGSTTTSCSSAACTAAAPHSSQT